ncbi:MAG TPA: hypothetical protein VNZ01_00915 [Solirubrobacteraceae bacterium]|jgi:hypothetical protein|nr:hypothetical protein [Solirubrobacteraceae bacterium]
MTELLSSIKSDLLDRRMLPLLLALGAALVGAVAYAVLGGSTGAAEPPASPPVARAVGIAVSETPSNPNQPVAETTNGSTVQKGGNSRNPFAPLVSAKAATTSSTSKTSASGSSTAGTKAGSGATPTSGSGGGAPSKPAQPSTPRIVIHFHVTAQFGVPPAPPAPGAAPLPSQLTSYENMTVDQPLPDKQNPQVVFLGVLLPSGKSAVFALIGEPILHGNGKCLPSATQCQAIQLLPGQSETLETIDASNNTVTYELKLVSITSSRSSASAAKAHAAFRAPSKDQRELLRRAGLAVLPALKGAQGAGMLVFIPRRAHAARAHMTLQRRHPSG